MKKNECLSYDDTKEWCDLLGLTMVPTIWRGIFDEEFLKNYKFDTETQEGFVIRLSESFKFEDFSTSVAKYVRENHVKTDKHWSNSWIKNDIQC